MTDTATGRAVLDIHEADGADDVTDHFPIQRESAGQSSLLLAEPAGQDVGKAGGVHALEQLAEDSVAGGAS